MAAFPSLPFHIGSQITYEDGLVVERSSAGALRARSFYPNQKANILLRMDMLTRAQVYQDDATSVMGFFIRWKAGTNPPFAGVAMPSFTVTLDSITYTVVFRGPPRLSFVDYNIYNCEVNLAEV